MKFKILQSNWSTLDINLAIGQSTLIYEMPVQLIGFKAEINDTNWVIQELNHALDDKGYTCSIKLVEIVSDE